MHFDHQYENYSWRFLLFSQQQLCVQWNAAQQQANWKEVASTFLLFLYGWKKQSGWLLQVKEIPQVQNFLY